MLNLKGILDSLFFFEQGNFPEENASCSIHMKKAWVFGVVGRKGHKGPPAYRMKEGQKNKGIFASAKKAEKKITNLSPNFGRKPKAVPPRLEPWHGDRCIPILVNG